MSSTESVSAGRERKTANMRVWQGGIAGGLLGGIGMGVVLHFGANQMTLFGALVGDPTVTAGWLVHLAFSVLFGMAFAAIVSSSPFRELRGTVTSYVGLGFAYGVLLGLFAGGFLLPLSLNRFGTIAYPVPFLPLPGVASELLFAFLLTAAHLVYGVVLGAVYGTIVETVPADAPTGEATSGQ